jgi:hypothetical protein
VNSYQYHARTYRRLMKLAEGSKFPHFAAQTREMAADHGRQCGLPISPTGPKIKLKESSDVVLCR